MEFKKLPSMQVRSYEVEPSGPKVAFECPSCTREVNISEIIEQGGNIRCVKCS